MLNQTKKVLACVISFSALLAGCSSEVAEVPAVVTLSVGGTYNTAVTLGANTCTGVVVQQHNTIITHTANANTLTVSHNGIVYGGAVTNSAAFTTTPKTFENGESPLTLSIAGQFTTTGMTATVTVVQSGVGPCQYTVAWAGAKQGSPNVIPM